MNFTLAALRQRLDVADGSQHFHIAFSGGLDSCVLVHAMSEILAEGVSWTCSAVHVHHGLNTEADQWSQFCQQFCANRGIECVTVAVDASPIKGESPEALARKLRYQALATLIKPHQVLLTAQHQTDQAETLLLQLLRGSGVTGLSAMPSQIKFSKGVLLRPLLDFTRRELLQYARQQQLAWVEDNSNEDCQFDRNYLRHEIIPLIEKRWPSTSSTLSRTAQHMAEANDLLKELANNDLVHARESDNSLNLAALAQLTPMRQRNLLRYWIQQQGVLMPSEKLMQQIQQQFIHTESDSQPHVQWGGYEIRRYREILYLMKSLSNFDSTQHFTWDMTEPLQITGSGQLEAVKSVSDGVSVSRLATDKLTVKFRQGGEVIRPAGKRHHSSLKKLFQQADIPPWVRERIPLLYHQDKLVAVAGLCVAEEFAVQGQELAKTFHWQASFQEDL